MAADVNMGREPFCLWYMHISCHVIKLVQFQFAVLCRSQKYLDK